MDNKEQDKINKIGRQLSLEELDKVTGGDALLQQEFVSYQAETGDSANIQTQMVQLQDYMGQYNSYMQGAN